MTAMHLDYLVLITTEFHHCRWSIQRYMNGTQRLEHLPNLLLDQIGK
jgi:hypothetical protein